MPEPYAVPYQERLNRRGVRDQWVIPDMGSIRVVCRMHWKVDGIQYMEGSAKKWIRHPRDGEWVVWVAFADLRMHQGGTWLEVRDVRRVEKAPASWRAQMRRDI